MKIINVNEIINAIETLCINSNYYLNSDIESAIKRGIENEKSEIGKGILEQLLKNSEIAREEKKAICQARSVKGLEIRK